MKIGFFSDIVLKENITVGPKLEKVMLTNDYNIINFEAAYRDKYAKVKSRLGTKLFFKDENIEFLNNHNITVANLSNNHIMDFSKKGLERTIDILNQNNIHYFGAGFCDTEAEKPFVINDKDCIIYIYGFSARNTNATIANKISPGVSHLSYNNVKRAIQKYSIGDSKKRTINIVFAHCGKEYTNYPEPYYKHVFDKLLKAKTLNINTIICCHAHAPQGYFSKEEKFCSYGMGNFAIPEGIYEGGSIVYHSEGKYGYGVIFSCSSNRIQHEIISYCISDSGKNVELLEYGEKVHFENQIATITAETLVDDNRYFHLFNNKVHHSKLSAIRTYNDF